MTLLAECPVHELTAGLGKGANGDADGTWEEKRELKALLQPSRNWPMHQAQCYAHQDCNLRIKRGCRYLLHGRNGVGKSTLLSAIANRDNGLQSFPKEVDTFLLDQELGFLRNQEDNAVIDIVLEHASSTKTALQEEAERLETMDEITDETLSRLCEIYEEIDAHRTHVFEEHSMMLLKGLGFRKGKENAKLGSLSGGWRSRVGLACALVRSPAFLMLDEPTNHLDVNAIVWLQEYLKWKYEGEALLFVTHDRMFAEEVATDVIVMAEQRLQYFNNMTLGEYETSVNADKLKMEHQVSNLEKKKEVLRKQKAAASKAAHSGDAKAGHQAAKLSKKLGRMGLEKTADGRKWNCQRDGVRLGADNNNCGGWVKGKRTHAAVLRRVDPELGFGFPKGDPSGLAELEVVFELRSPGYRYAGCSSDALVCGDIPISTNCRLAIVGRNGEGKTTLVRLLAGDLEPTRGEIRRDHGYRVFHLSQSAHDRLAVEKRSALQLLLASKQGGRETDVRQHLARFGVIGSQALRPLCEMSGGQRVRVAIAHGAVFEPHCLLFDEPTNHLDMGSIDRLGESLNAFDGAVIICTHDRALIAAVAKTILLVKKGKANILQESPAEYLKKLKK